MIRSVIASGRSVIAVLALAVCLGTPALEMFDRWDQTLQDGNDTESNLVIAVLCVGAGFVVAGALHARMLPAITRTIACPNERLFSHVTIAAAPQPRPTVSPPAVLRV
jgi:hypothetical protein